MAARTSELRCFAGALVWALAGTPLAARAHDGPLAAPPASAASAQTAAVARGTVYLDANRNGRRDSRERGVPGVSVSNGIEVVQTDRFGSYAIGLPEERILFISKPAEYAIPVDARNLPQFYYIHSPQGTPDPGRYEYPVIEPTGPLPERIDFALWPGELEREFKAMAFADPQARTEEFQDQLRVDVVNELIGNPYGAAFGITAGDVVDDTLSLYDRHTKMMGLIGIPMWNVPGNHDMNLEAPSDRYATETFKRVFGPTYFSFDHGSVHFVGLDNVQYKGQGQGEFDNGDYRGYVSEDQLEWLRNDLRFVPRWKLIVIATHISLITHALDGKGERFALGDNINTVNLAALLEVLRPFRRVYAIAGHDTSNSWKVKIDHSHGWRGYPIIAHTLAETRGGGWSNGPRDERGVRPANMQDGNPNGYYVMSFEGTEVQPRFIPASGDPNRSMRVVLDPPLRGAFAPDGSVLALERGQWTPGTKLVVNLFDGGERDQVEASLDGAPFARLHNVLRNDPFMERLYERYRGTPDAYARPEPSSHLFELALPTALAPGLHAVEVRALDEFGQRSRAHFSFELLP